jgi:hypothetical protein
MEKDDLIEDGFLRDLIGSSPLEGPPEGFVEKVMAGIQDVPVVETTGKSFYLYLKSAMPYIGLAAMVFLFVFSSDMHFGKYLPGTDYLSKYFLPIFGSLVGGFKSLFASRYVTFAMGIAVSAGFLVLVEHLLSNRRSMNHPMV